MANPGDFAYTLKQQADILRIVGDYVKLKRSGAQNYSGLCPFHGEKTPSFSVHATRQFYHCFGCGVSGDVFSFVQKIENVSFPEAIRLVAEKLGIPLPKVSYGSPEEAREARQRGVLMEINERACLYFQEQLSRPEAAHARSYLAGRGLTEELIREFRIGFAPDSGFLLRDRFKGEWDEDVLKASGLFSWKESGSDPGTRPVSFTQPSPSPEAAAKTSDAPRPIALYSKFRNRIMFPICNESGRVIAFTGRTLNTDEKSGPKYLNSPETPIYSKSRVLFNLDKAREPIRKLEYTILVEGQMDCISLYSAKFRNVIASSGTAFSELHARLLSRYSRKIVVNFDPDAAGAAAAERTLGLLVAEDFEIKVLTLDAGLDPDSFIRQRGREAYEAALRSAPRYFDFLIERARTLFSTRTPEGKVKALNYLLPHIHRVPSRIVRDELAMEIAHKLAIDPGVLLQELKHAAVNRTSKPVNVPAASSVTEAERILIRALASAGQLQSGRVSSSSREGEDHEFEPDRQVHFILDAERLHEGLTAEGLIDTLLQASAAGTSDVMAVPLSDPDRRLLAEALIQEEEELEPELVESAIAALRRRRLEQRKRQITHQIAEAERLQDSQAVLRLRQEKLAIDRMSLSR
ncbi:MAG TPA: DNA primase [Terriglobales bacterium]|nr:DNA primase [Terriglobales bacterium]